MNGHALRTALALSLCAAVLAFVPQVARADTKAQIIDRMAGRLEAINKEKADGRIGETFDGLVDAVKAESLGDKKLKKLIDDENADRKAFYALAAKELETTPERVALSAGRRNFRVAEPNEWLKPSDGKWIRKKDLKDKPDSGSSNPSS